MRDVRDYVVLITGATSGIGLSMAKVFAQRGNTLIITASDQQRLNITKRALQKAYHVSVEAICQDLSEPDAARKLYQKIKEKKYMVNILVNNAGGYPKQIYNNIEHQAIKIWEWSEEQWDQIIKTNLRIPFLCINKVVPEMIKQHSGKIVSVSSRMGRIASQMGAYAVAKAGIVTMTKTTAIQTKEHGIQCNAVAPGIVDTPGQRVYNHSVGQDGVAMGNAEDVAKAIVYLLADAPFVMTGQVIDLFTTV